MPAPADPDFIARVLIEASILGDEAAAARYNISVRTVERYRAKLAADPRLAAFVAGKKKASEAEWAHGLASALKGNIDFLNRASAQADPSSPEAIHAVAGALKILAEVSLASKMLDVRLAERSRAEAEEARSASADEEDSDEEAEAVH